MTVYDVWNLFKNLRLDGSFNSKEFFKNPLLFFLKYPRLEGTLNFENFKDELC